MGAEPTPETLSLRVASMLESQEKLKFESTPELKADPGPRLGPLEEKQQATDPAQMTDLWLLKPKIDWFKATAQRD